MVAPAGFKPATQGLGRSTSPGGAPGDVRSTGSACVALQPDPNTFCLDWCGRAGLSQPLKEEGDVDEAGADECDGELEILLAVGDELGDHQVVRLETQPASRLGVRSLDDDESLRPAVRQDRDGDCDSLAVVAVGAMA